MVDSTQRLQGGSEGFGVSGLFRTTTTMSLLDSELQEKLAGAGDKLVDPPESVEELLSLLDQLEGYLSKVEQSPSPPMQRAYSISVKALVQDKLFKHSDTDVRIAVASCISEITRISAPEAPYGDEKMKEVFQLIVSSFENLSENSSRSYAKRCSILGTVAKVRSCVVMLDLECDTLILEMFQHFFKEIREYHPEDVFTAMESIMVLVIDESEDVCPELVSLILTTVKKDNEVSPIVKKLGEKVLQGCTSKLEPCLPQLLKSLGVSSSDYSRIVSSICQELTDATYQNDVHHDDVQKLHEEPAEEVATPQQVDAAPDRSPQSVMSTGEVKEERDDSVVDSASAKNEEHGPESNTLETTKLSHCEFDKQDTNDAVKIESQPEPKKRRGRKPKSSKKRPSSVNGSKSVKETNGKENDRSKEPENEDENDIQSSASEKQTVEDSVQSESDKEAVIEPSSPHADEDEPVKDVSPSHSQDLPQKTKPKKGKTARKKKTVAKEETPVPEVSKKSSEEMSEDEVETPSRKENEIADEEPSKVDDDSDATSGSEAKPMKQPAKKADGDKKRTKKCKTVPEKQVKTPAKEDVEKVVKKRGREENTDETPSNQTKKKRTPAKEDISNHNEYGEELVGSRIKVWWPMDKAFYKGKISSFDPVKKKHKVSYVDGDVEVLLLKKERWKIVSDDDESESDEELVEDEEDEESPDASPERPARKKGRTKFGSPKKDKTETSSSKKGGVASSKSKQAATTGSSRKLKSGEKTENGNDLKLKNNKNNKENEVKTPKTAKSKEREVKSSAKATSKTTKSKQQQQQQQEEEEGATSASKGKTPQNGGKSTANGKGGSKTQVSKSVSGKKRRRGI